jgi:UDPglucose 6-dehydrogenase
MREAPSINLIKSIVNVGGRVSAYDPKAINEAKFYLKDIEIVYADDKYSALEDADALILVTEWKEFRSPDFDLMRSKMKGHLFIDGRNQFTSDFVQSKGFKYIQIGVKA